MLVLNPSGNFTQNKKYLFTSEKKEKKEKALIMCHKIGAQMGELLQFTGGERVSLK